MEKRRILLITAMLFLAGCVRTQPQIVVITATATTITDAINVSAAAPTMPVLPTDAVVPTANLPETAREYIVQSGDTLSGIAAANDVSVEAILAINDIPDPNVLSVGQVIYLPAPPNKRTSTFRIISDSRLVRGPGSRAFEITSFINQQPGYIRSASDIVDDKLLQADEIVGRVSLEFSVDARLLLALLEYRAQWLSQTELGDNAKTYPMQGGPSPDGFDRAGLYKQLSWAANQLNRGYYGWKYRGLTTLEFDDGTRLLYAPGLNAGTIGVQYFLSLNTTYANWEQAIGQGGFYQTYVNYFGDPFGQIIDPLIPPALTQPEMTLPFLPGETWFFTGGPHGGWGNGSAWAAVDFAPPDDRTDDSPPCYISKFWAAAVAPGLIARSAEGVVILDLDGDGDEATGWSVLYLHMATEGRVPAGTAVRAGDMIGHPSCEGGFSNGTHMHIARRYNGEWLPVYCDSCRPENIMPQFVMSGWAFFGLTDQEYQGYIINGNERREADQGRLNPANHIGW